MTPAAQHLRALARAAATGETPPREAVAWVCVAAHRLTTGRAATMDSALGLDSPGPGRRRRFGRLLLEIRNQHLASAYALIRGESCESRLRLLARAVRRAKAAWEQSRDTGSTPELLTAMDAHLFLAFQVANGRVPTSTRRLRDAVFGGFDENR